MPDVYQLCSNTRMRLWYPRNNRPDDMMVLNQVSTEIRTVKRHQRNTSNVWNFNDLIIDTSPGESTYQINAADFGTPLSVISYAPQLITWIPRLIPIYQPQNMVYAYGDMPNLAGHWNTPYDGSNCTAERVAFYWRDNAAYIEFLPVPQLPAQYQVRYLQSANGVGDLALTSSPITNEDADIVETRAALVLLGGAEWQAPDSKDGRMYNDERRNNLMKVLLGSERELRRQFEAAQLQVEGDRLTQRYNPTVG